MRMQQLRYFIVVAKCGSINRAADRLFISQQALRSSINALERELGFPLFVRSSLGAQLTEQGAAILADAEQILAIADGWQRFAHPTITKPETVEVLASTISCNTVLTAVVKECRSAYPGLQIRFFHTRDDEMMATMTDRSIGIIASAPDTIIRTRLRPFSERLGLDVEAFGADRFCIYVNTANPLAKQRSVTTQQLRGLTLAAYPGEDQNFFYKFIHRYFSDTPPFFIEKQESIFQIISEMSDVAAVFPHLAIFNNRYVEQGLVTALPVEDYPMPGSCCLMYPKAETQTPGQQVVIGMIRRRLENLLRELSLTQ